MASLNTSFLGIAFPNPFILSSAPTTANGSMVKNAFEIGWGGAVLKTIGLEPTSNPSPRLHIIKSGRDKRGMVNIELISTMTVEDWEREIDLVRDVYPKAWAATPIFKPPTGEDNIEKTKEIFENYKSWKMTADIMEEANHEAVYMHCLPADRGHEVTNEVMDRTDVKRGWKSVVFDEAENRLHVQKAVMSLVMGGRL